MNSMAKRTIDDVLKMIEDLSSDDDQRPTPPAAKPVSPVFGPCFRGVKPKSGRRSSSSALPSSSASVEPKVVLRTNGKIVFQVVWGKYKPYKKHKYWSGDGFLVIPCNNNNKSVLFYDISGKIIGSTKGLKSVDEYVEGKRLVIGQNEIEIINEIAVSSFETGSCFEKSDA